MFQRRVFNPAVNKTGMAAISGAPTHPVKVSTKTPLFSHVDVTFPCRRAEVRGHDDETGMYVKGRADSGPFMVGSVTAYRPGVSRITGGGKFGLTFALGGRIHMPFILGRNRELSTVTFGVISVMPAGI